MRKLFRYSLLTAAAAAILVSHPRQALPSGDEYSVAVLPFLPLREKPSPLNRTITELVSARLAAAPHIVLVERSHVAYAFEELGLDPDTVLDDTQAREVCAFVGAGIYVRGRTLKTNGELVLNARIIGAASSFEEAVLISRPRMGRIAPLMEELAEEIGSVIAERGPLLLAGSPPPEKALASLQARLTGQSLPRIEVRFSESYDGQDSSESPAEKILVGILEQTGFSLPGNGNADVLITAEASGITGSRRGRLVSNKVSIELRAVSGDDQLLAVATNERWGIDIFASLAGSKALQSAIEEIAPEFIAAAIKGWNSAVSIPPEQ